MKIIKKHFINTSFILTAIGFFAILSACNSTTNTTDATSPVPEKVASDTIELTKAQIVTVGVETGFPEKRNLGDLIKVNGQLMIPPESKAEVNTLIGGVVRKILVKEGNYVRKGQVLAYIENPEFIRMQQDYLTTKSNLVYVTQEYERQKRLNDQNAGTGKVFQQAQATYLSEQAKLNSLRRQLQQIHINTSNLDKGTLYNQIPIWSPISGQVSHILINIGSSADMNKTLMEVIDDSSIYCDLKIFQKDLNKVKVGQKITFQVNEQTEKAFSGKIRSINATYETANRIVIAHASIDHQKSDPLIPGSYVTASVLLGDKTVLAVPTDAVISAEGKEFIFVVLAESDTAKPVKKNPDQEVRFKKIEVITGISNQGYTEIKLLETLPENTRIVTKGARYVLAQSQTGQSDDE